jgi:predicted MPP superfamily phosphohydrolase
VSRRPQRKRLVRALTRPPFRDELGRKGWLEPFTRAQSHAVRKLSLALPGWPRWPRPLRIAFLSDFHTGSHAGDIARFEAIVAEALAQAPDLALFGGDYVNMQAFGGGRVPPNVTATIMARLAAPCGRFAVIGNHDVAYGEEDVCSALRGQGIVLLDDEQAGFRFQSHDIAIVGIPDAKVDRAGARALLARLPRETPAIVLTHDPFWYSQVTSPSHLTLAGHTHGGQIRLPFVGAVINQSEAPLRWTLGHIVEEGRHLYVTGGLGTSGVPLRVGVAPEYVLLEVNGKSGNSP